MAFPEFIIAVDLGQVSDPTAICVLERREDLTDRGRWFPRRAAELGSHYSVIHLERLALMTAYTAIPSRIHAIEGRCRELWMQSVWEEERAAVRAGRPVRHYPTRDDAPVQLVIDQTGAGRPVLDLFRAAGLDPLGLTITGGDHVTRVSAFEVHVAKRHLVSTVQALMQSGRVKAASGLADWSVLRAELGHFKAKISLSGHASFEAGSAESWREGAHDDLVLALAMGLWTGENQTERRMDPIVAAAFADLPR